MRRASAAIWRKTRCYPLRTFSSSVNTSPTTQITTLPNKIRVATDDRPGHFSCVGLYVDAGARHETQHTSGIFHFLDRMAFKVNHLMPAFLYAFFFTHYKSITEHCESVWRANGFSHRFSWWSNNVFFFSRINDVPILPCT